MPDHLQTLREREAYLQLRAEAKRKLGWEWSYDERERAALAWAIAELTAAGLRQSIIEKLAEAPE